MGVFVQLRVATEPNNMINTWVGYLEGMLANRNPKPLCLYKRAEDIKGRKTQVTEEIHNLYSSADKLRLCETGMLRILET
jgi:hypothetical protein